MRIQAAGLGISIALSLGIGPALAEPASVIRGEECSLTANETTYIASRTLRIVTKSAANVVIWTCKFDIPDYTGGLFQDRGFACLVETGAGPVSTTMSQATISPAGKGTLICRVRSNE
jgi:hypothetical protein